MNRESNFHANEYENRYICVPVIASFDRKGNFCPLHVKIDGNIYKVNSFWIKYEGANLSEFICRIIDGNIEKPLILRYVKDRCQWYMPNSKERVNW